MCECVFLKQRKPTTIHQHLDCNLTFSLFLPFSHISYSLATLPLHLTVSTGLPVTTKKRFLYPAFFVCVCVCVYLFAAAFMCDVVFFLQYVVIITNLSTFPLECFISFKNSSIFTLVFVTKYLVKLVTPPIVVILSSSFNLIYFFCILH